MVLKNLAIIFIGFLWFTTPGLHAHVTHTISGTVRNKDTQDPVAFANVLLDNAGSGSTTGTAGRFSLKAAPGEHTLRVSIIGYRTFSLDVSVTKDLTLDLELEPADLLYDQVVISATKIPINRWEADASIEVIDAEMLENRGLHRVDEALDFVSSVHLKDNGGSNIKTASIRGSTSSQVLILVDGARVNNLQTVSSDLGLFSLQNVERIEIYRGGNSAFFGSNAVGGIINVVSKPAAALQPFHAGISTRISTVRAQTYSGFLAGHLGNFNARVAVQHEQQPDSSLQVNHGGRNVRLVNSGSRTDNAFLSLDYRIDASSRLSWTSHFVNRKTGIIETISNNFTSIAKAEQSDWMTVNSLRFLRPLGGKVTTEVSISHVFNRILFEDPTLPGDSPGTHLKANHRTHSFQGESRTDINFDVSNQASIGFLAARETAVSTSLSSAERDQTGLFLAHRLRLPVPVFFDRFILQPVYRLDRHSNSGIKNNYKIGATLLKQSPATLFSVRSSYGTNYREPGFNDLFWSDAFGSGNPDLKAERSGNVDAGFQIERMFPSANVTFEVNYFRNESRDLIAWKPGSDGIWQPENIDRTVSQGVEVLQSFASKKTFLLSWSYTFTRALDKRADPGLRNNQLRYVPRHTASATAEIFIRRMRLNLSYKFTGERFDDSANRVSLQPYHLFNLRLARDIDFKRWKVSASVGVQNLLNEQYEEVVQFPAASRTLEFGVALSY